MARNSEKTTVRVAPFGMDFVFSIYYLAAPLLLIELKANPVQRALWAPSRRRFTWAWLISWEGFQTGLGGAVAHYAGLRAPYVLCLAVLVVVLGVELVFIRKENPLRRCETPHPPAAFPALWQEMQRRSSNLVF